MSAAPVTVHASPFSQSRLPIVLHRIIPAGTISMYYLGMLEAAAITNLIYIGLLRPQSSLPLDRMYEIALPMAVGAGLYKMAPP
jgi:hypothetical protein